MKMERELGFSVKAAADEGEGAGKARRTSSFEDPKLPEVVRLTVNSYVRSDEKSKAELDRLNAQVDPYFRHSDLK